MKIVGLYILIPVLVATSLNFFEQRTVGIAMLTLGILVWTVFIVWYSLRSKWWKNPYGRNIMGISFGLVALMLAFAAQVYFGRYVHYEAVWAFVFTNLVVLGLSRTYHMEMAQREMRNRPHLHPRRRATDTDERSCQELLSALINMNARCRGISPNTLRVELGLEPEK